MRDLSSLMPSWLHGIADRIRPDCERFRYHLLLQHRKDKASGQNVSVSISACQDRDTRTLSETCRGSLQLFWQTGSRTRRRRRKRTLLGLSHGNTDREKKPGCQARCVVRSALGSLPLFVHSHWAPKSPSVTPLASDSASRIGSSEFDIIVAVLEIRPRTTRLANTTNEL